MSETIWFIIGVLTGAGLVWLNMIVAEAARRK